MDRRARALTRRAGRPAPRRTRPAAAALLAAGALAAAAMAPARGDPAAWRVSEGRGELWLLGSVHYLREKDYPLPAVVDELYARADGLVFEIDLDHVDPAEAEFTSAARLPPGASLATELGPELYGLADARAREFGVDLAPLDRFEPWLAAITLLDRGMAAHGFDAGRGIEQYLLAKAQHDGKHVQGLESLAAEIHVFDDLSAADQRSLLEQTLDELETPERSVEPLVTAWRDGRADELGRALLTDFADFPALYDSLVVDRNRAWTPELERHLAAGDRLLVVVGALHLVGPHSVVDLLRRDGHDVRRLR